MSPAYDTAVDLQANTIAMHGLSIYTQPFAAKGGIFF